MPCEDGRDPGPIVLRRQLAESEQHNRHTIGIYEQRVKTHIEMLRDQCRHLENLVVPVGTTMTEEVQKWWYSFKIEEAKRLEAIKKAERSKKVDQYMKLKKELGL